MKTFGYCDLSDLPIDMCSHCKGLDPPVLVHHGEPEHRVARRIKAQYDGYCGLCGEWMIREGDWLYLVTDNPEDKHDGVWAGQCCIGDRK